MEDFKKKYNRILEYVTLQDVLDEAGDENQPMDMPPMGGQDDTGNPDMMGGETDSAMAPMGGMPDGDMPPMDGAGGAGPEGFNPEGADDMGGGMVGGPDDAQGGLPENPDLGVEQPGDEVIDVDDLTNSQEETEAKIDKISDKFGELLKKLDSFTEKIADNDKKIEAVRKEIEKRNPTPVEKLTLRSKDGYPFNVSPDEYWEKKEGTSNYSTEDDNNGADDEKYKITKADVDNISDWQTIAKSMEKDKMTLNDILDF